MSTVPETKPPSARKVLGFFHWTCSRPGSIHAELSPQGWKHVASQCLIVVGLKSKSFPFLFLILSIAVGLALRLEAASVSTTPRLIVYERQFISETKGTFTFGETKPIGLPPTVTQIKTTAFYDPYIVIVYDYSGPFLMVKTSNGQQVTLDAPRKRIERLRRSLEALCSSLKIGKSWNQIGIDPLFQKQRQEVSASAKDCRGLATHGNLLAKLVDGRFINLTHRNQDSLGAFDIEVLTGPALDKAMASFKTWKAFRLRDRIETALKQVVNVSNNHDSWVYAIEFHQNFLEPIEVMLLAGEKVIDRQILKPLKQSVRYEKLK